MRAEAIRNLQAFIDERWAVAQPKFYPGAAAGPVVPPEVTEGEARNFLSAVATRGDEPPLLVVDDDRRQRSDRCPRLADGSLRGYSFFDSPGRLRLETIVHWATVARLRDDFGWPREHLVCESPDLVNDGRVVLRYDALDILLLEQPCEAPPARMLLESARSLVGVEAKADVKLLEKLLKGMRACHADGAPHVKTDHVKCSAIAELGPRLFLGVAAAETWRLFTVVERHGRATLGDELPNLERLQFSSLS